MPATPDGWMSKTRTLDPADYDRFRPTYPSEIFTAINDYVALSADMRCLEIGIGTGQTTEWYIDAGCDVVALEPAANLSEYTRDKYRSQPKLEIREQRFEEMAADERFDLIYAATSFHWIEGDDRLQRLRNHLTRAGAVALYWIHPAPRDPLHADLQPIYAKYRPEPAEPSANKRLRSDIETFPAELAAAEFSDVQTNVSTRVRTLTTAEYIGLLHTYSDQLSMPDATRIPLMEGIAAVIDTYGGTIEIDDTIELHLARRG